MAQSEITMEGGPSRAGPVEHDVHPGAGPAEGSDRAVDATIKSLKDNTTLPGHLPSLVAALAPAVKAVADQPGDKLVNATRRNVSDNVAKLKAAAPILSEAVGQGKLKIVGGIYRLGDGKVELLS